MQHFFRCHGAHDSVHYDAYVMMHTWWHGLNGAYGMRAMIWIMSHDVYIFLSMHMSYCKNESGAWCRYYNAISFKDAHDFKCNCGAPENSMI